jgi:hypothetical protein
MCCAAGLGEAVRLMCFSILVLMTAVARGLPSKHVLHSRWWHLPAGPGSCQPGRQAMMQRLRKIVPGPSKQRLEIISLYYTITSVSIGLPCFSTVLFVLQTHQQGQQGIAKPQIYTAVDVMSSW